MPAHRALSLIGWISLFGAISVNIFAYLFVDAYMTIIQSLSFKIVAIPLTFAFFAASAFLAYSLLYLPEPRMIMFYSFRAILILSTTHIGFTYITLNQFVIYDGQRKLIEISFIKPEEGGSTIAITGLILLFLCGPASSLIKKYG